MLELLLLAMIGADLPPVPWDDIPHEVAVLKAQQVALRNDVEALKRDLTKCDVASKSPDPKPGTKCPDGTCADCKCKVGSECGCLKLTGSELVAAASESPKVSPANSEGFVETPKVYREVRTCNGGTCTVQMVPVDAVDETPPVMMQQRSTYGNGGCVGGSCGVSRTRRGFFGRRR